MNDAAQANDPVNPALVEKICRLLCKRKYMDPGTRVCSQMPQIQPWEYSTFYVVPGEHQTQPMWTIYREEARMVLEILQSGQFILPNHVEEKHQYAEAQAPTPNVNGSAILAQHIITARGPKKQGP